MTTSPDTEFTVVIPAYNPGSLLDEALASLAAQTSRPAWVVIVDDGSTDGTADRANNLLTTRGITGVVLRQTNQGIAAARNAGLEARKTNWVALLDADDIWMPDHLARLQAAIRQCPEAVVAFGDTRYFGDPRSRTSLHAQAKTLPLSIAQPSEGIHVLSTRVFDALLPGLFLPVSASAFRMDCCTPEPRFDPQLRTGEDRYFFLQMSRRGTFVFSDRQTAGTRRHESNTTHHFNAARLNADLVILLDKILNAQEFKLDADQRAAIGDQAVAAADLLMYSSSREGWVAHRDARRLAAAYLKPGPAAAARNMIRALAVSAGLMKAGQPDRSFETGRPVG